MAIPNIKALGRMVSDKKSFYVSPYLRLCKACDPWGVAIYDPRGLI